MSDEVWVKTIPVKSDNRLLDSPLDGTIFECCPGRGSGKASLRRRGFPLESIEMVRFNSEREHD